ncbi:MAG: DUF1772 domain-containing protein [Thermocrispum sp.]
MIIAGTIVAAVGCGLIAGLFYVFSGFAMRSLGRMEPQHGAAAMRNINEDILNPLFLLILLGTAVLSAVLTVVALANWSEPGSAWRLTGGLLYVVGVFGVTTVFNVPMNNRLAASDPSTAEGQAYWREYLRNWTAWNHVRTIASTAALAALLLAVAAD